MAIPSNAIVSAAFILVLGLTPLVLSASSPPPKTVRPESSGTEGGGDSDSGEYRRLLFTPQTPRTEADRDRLHAQALYAHGRLLFRRRDLPAALQRYQRAWRYDPEVVSVLGEIVPIAFALNRQDVATRYAVIAAEREGADANLLKQLAAVLARDGHARRAIGLLKAARSRQEERQDRSSLLLGFEIGRLYFLTDQVPEAARELSRLRGAFLEPQKYGLNSQQLDQLFPRVDLVRRMIGESLMLDGKPRQALAEFTAANRVKPNAAAFALAQARVAFALKDYDRAIELLGTAIRGDAQPDSSRPYELLGSILGQKFKDPAASSAEFDRRLENLRTALPKNLALMRFIARRHLQAGRFKAAETLLLAAIDQQPDADSYRSLIRMLIKRSDAPRLAEALGGFAQLTGGLEQLGQTGESLLESPALVKRILEEASLQAKSKSPAGGSLLVAAGELAIQAKLWVRADKLFDSAMKHRAADKAAAYSSWGLGLFGQDRFLESAAVFDRAAADSVISEEIRAEFHFYRSGSLVAAKRIDEAAGAARQAVALAPKSSRFRFRVGWIFYFGKRYKQAQEEFAKLLDIFDDDFSSEEIRSDVRETRTTMAAIHGIQNRRDLAAQRLEEVLDEFPEDVGALNDLGYLWADQGAHLLRAQQMIETAVRRAPGKRAYRDSLGWVYFRRGKYADAARELTLAAAAGPPDGIILDHLGDTRERMNQPERALDAWRRSAEAFRKNGDLAQFNRLTEKILKHRRGP